MAEHRAPIRFRARLLRPTVPKDADWTFVVLPKKASAKLPARGMVSVDGRLGGRSFQATLQPDGEGSHWLKVDKALREAATAEVGDTVQLVIAPVTGEPEPEVPADVRHAL